ncbi:MAG: HNH endonuclease [Oscillospiraceae bacterium]|nr:HNH endonuclease [Oscillospiraceae bacterium]
MHEQFANDFYRSVAWQKCRAAFISSRGGLCERCLSRGLCVAGSDVHHKIKLTPKNISDPDVTLSWSNLELLCRRCHQEIHAQRTERRWSVDETGALIALK